MGDLPYGFIYITENMTNHKKYIGKKTYDKCGKWHNYLGSGDLLQKAILKYGKENFRRTVIDVADSFVDLNEREKYWINYYDATNSDEFYNIANGGTGGNTKCGYTADELTISEAIRIKAIREGFKHKSGEDFPQAKLKKEQVTDIINSLLSGSYHTDLARKYNVSVSTINDIASHKTWKSLTDGIVFPTITREMVGKRSAKSCSKPVIAYNKDMDMIGEYPSAREAGKSLGVGYRLVSQVCNGEKPSAHGYIFMFSNN